MTRSCSFRALALLLLLNTGGLALDDDEKDKEINKYKSSLVGSSVVGPVEVATKHMLTDSTPPSGLTDVSTKASDPEDLTLPPNLNGDQTKAPDTEDSTQAINLVQVGGPTTPSAPGLKCYQKRRNQIWNLIRAGTLVGLSILAHALVCWIQSWIDGMSLVTDATTKLSSTTISAFFDQMRPFLIAGLATIAVIFVIGLVFLVYQKCVTKQDRRRKRQRRATSEADVEASVPGTGRRTSTPATPASSPLENGTPENDTTQPVKRNVNKPSTQRKPSSIGPLTGSTATQKKTSNINTSPTYISTGFTADSNWTQSSDNLRLPTHIRKVYPTYPLKYSAVSMKPSRAQVSTTVSTKLDATSENPGFIAKFSSTFSELPHSKNVTHGQKDLNVSSKTPKKIKHNSPLL